MRLPRHRLRLLHFPLSLLPNTLSLRYDEDCPCGYPGIAYGYYPTGSPGSVTCSINDWGYVR